MNESYETRSTRSASSLNVSTYYEESDSSDSIDSMDSKFSQTSNQSQAASLAHDKYSDDSDSDDYSETYERDSISAEMWSKYNKFEPKNVEFTGNDVNYHQNYEEPIDFFHQFMPKSIFKTFMEQTNLYANRKHIKLNVSIEEIEVYIGILIHMGFAKMPQITDYWERNSYYPPIARVMTKSRFTLIKSCFHIVDNDLIKTADGYDKLFKVRPLYDVVKENCQKLDVPEYLSIGKCYFYDNF